VEKEPINGKTPKNAHLDGKTKSSYLARRSDETTPLVAASGAE
jgi:hypothetical protein